LPCYCGIGAKVSQELPTFCVGGRIRREMAANKIAKHAVAALPAVPNLLRRVNQRRILEAVQAHGPISRAALVRKTGISPPTVSKLVESLLKSRLLEEAPPKYASAGRPAKLLRLAGQRACIMAAVVDIRQCTLAAAGLDGKLDDARTVHFPTPNTYEKLLDALAEHARRLAPDRGEKASALALGLSIPGLIDRRRQQVLLSANLHLLDSRFPADDLRQRTGVPVALFHETDALCLGERAWGQARGMDDVVLIDATGGLGMAVMLGGQLMAGHHGLAGEIGHITVEPRGSKCGCGNRGCLEAYVSGPALVRKAKDGLDRGIYTSLASVAGRDGSRLTVEAINEAAIAGDKMAFHIVDEAGEKLGVAIASALNLLGCPLVVIGGGLSNLCDAFYQGAERAMRTRALPMVSPRVKIVRSSLDTYAAAWGAAIAAVDAALEPQAETEPQRQGAQGADNDQE